MRGKCERRGGSVNVAAEGANIIRREAKGYAGEGERGRGSVKAEGAGAEVFAGDGCSQGASFGPMALISRRGQGRRINNTRTREWLRRKCVKPADLTTHSPPKICSRPSRATRPSRTPPLPHAATMHARRPHDPFPTEDLRSPPHTSAPPRSPDAHPQAARCTPADLTTHSPPKACSRPRTTTRPPRALSHSLPAHFRSPAPRRCTPADLTTHSPSKICSHPRTATRPSPALLPHPRSPDARPQAAQRPHRKPAPAPPRSATLPPPLFRFGHKKTAPHSACAMPNVSVDRRCGRSFGLVSRALFAAVAGRWRVGVGLRPQPWALRSRRCGRVLRA